MLRKVPIMKNSDDPHKGQMDTARAQRLISAAIAESLQRPEFREKEAGKLWVMLVQASDAGTFRALLKRAQFEEVAKFSAGRITREQWARWEQSAGIWVWSVVIDGEASYSEVTELKIEGSFENEGSRRCSAVLADGTACPIGASFVCMERDGLQHFACGAHGDVHDFVRMPLADFLAAVAAGQPLTNLWQAGPGAAEDAKQASSQSAGPTLD